MAPTRQRAMQYARRLLPALGMIITAGCSDESPLAPDRAASAPLMAAAGLDVVSIVALEGFLDAAGNTGEARDVNDRGQVVGYSSHGVGTRAALWDNSRFPTELATLGAGSMAEAISADGAVIVGWSSDGTNNYAVRWVKPAADWVIDALPYYPTATSCGASDVSEDGTVIGGQCELADGQHVIVWQNGAVRDMGKGYLAGVTADGVASTRYSPEPTAVLQSIAGISNPFEPPPATPLGTLGGVRSNAKGYDAAGSVVGISSNAAGDDRPFLWTAKKGMVDIGTLAGTTFAIPRAVSGDRIVGSSHAGSTSYATLWQKGKVVNLGTLPGYESSAASAISPGGMVAGYSSAAPGGYRATLWKLK